MRNADSPYLTDLFAISLRWLVLFGLAISLGTGGALKTGDTLNWMTVLVLALPALWNGFLSALAIFNRRLPAHRIINVALDIVLALALFIQSGGMSGPISWVALLPVFSSAVYFEARGALPVAIVISALQGAYAFLMSGPAFPLLTTGIIIGFNLISGLLVAVLSNPLVERLRKSYQGTLVQRKEGERRAQRRERDRMKTLFEMIETLSATLNYQTVMETIVETGIQALSGEQGVEEMAGAVLLFDDRNNLEFRAARGFIAYDTNVTLPAEEGLLREVFASGQTRLLEVPEQDQELGKIMTLHDHSVICLPLIRSMNAYGVILFAHTRKDFFTPERAETLEMLANQAVISLQNARLYQDLAREKERIIQTQEEANHKLARDLHDGPTQSVSAIAMRINIARKMMERSTKDALEELVKVEELARRTTQEIRHMLFTLRPLVLESEGLIAALNTMADKMHDLYQQNVVVDANPETVLLLDSTRQTVVFYLAEEAANNARKHAQASEIRVRMQLAPNDPCIVLLDIMDNGVGFDVKSVMDSYDRRGSLGMINLRERAELVNGLLKIDSVPGKGTRIRVAIPINDEGAERLHQNNHR